MLWESYYKVVLLNFILRLFIFLYFLKLRFEELLLIECVEIVIRLVRVLEIRD